MSVKPKIESHVSIADGSSYANSISGMLTAMMLSYSQLPGCNTLRVLGALLRFRASQPLKVASISQKLSRSNGDWTVCL